MRTGVAAVAAAGRRIVGRGRVMSGGSVVGPAAAVMRTADEVGPAAAEVRRRSVAAAPGMTAAAPVPTAAGVGQYGRCRYQSAQST